jgi:hypothetical protein
MAAFAANARHIPAVQGLRIDFVAILVRCTVYGVAELRIWPCAVTDKALRRYRRATDVAAQPLEFAALAGLGRRAGVQWRSALPLHMKPPQRERSHERVHSRERVRMHV